MQKRITPCPESDYFITIAYDGSVMPCSCMRPDNPEHQKYILGNVKDNTLLEIYHSKKAEEFRRIIRQADGDYPDPCKYCQKIRYENCMDAPTRFNFIGFDYLNKHSEKAIPLNT
jgi:radical SAM protein with 4Fe4S-binding SPASM domain